MIDYKDAGNKIRLQRKTLGLTQEFVSEQIGITPIFLSQIESGSRKAGIKTFLNLSKVLFLSLDYILGNQSAELSENNLTDLEYQILSHIRALDSIDKDLVLNIIICIQKGKSKGAL